MQAEERHQSQLLYVYVDSIQPPSFELRSDIEQANDPAFQELCNSVRETGVIEPLIVKPVENGRFELIAGGRRLRAAMLAGLKEVPVIVKPALSDIDAKVLAIAENLHRKDLSPIEKSRALIALYESAGYSAELSLKYLMRLDEDHYRGEAKRADAIVVPEHFKEIEKKLGLAANRQWQLLKFAVLDDDVLNYAKQKGLNGNKILMLTAKGIVEKGSDAHKRIIDHICNLREYEAREYIHRCLISTGRPKKQEESNPQPFEQQSAPSAEKQKEEEEEVVNTSRSERRYARLAHCDNDDKDSSRPASELAYLSVYDLCLPAEFLSLLKRRATIAGKFDLGQYLTYVLLYKLQRSNGSRRLSLPPAERAWFMSKNKGCATVRTEKEKMREGES
ncbi:ParB-like partition protein [Candidatus Nitrososphaera evergladensis SR1]|uniref:ParB-like partition protein n=1 Tax=Candidatus Nitrososphaera evergladensis SR1 TaxID=1459636 RepID=A0A075MQA5_9ARCH|nr:ParB/RepB/Spo0J family partition protein [Candidatus Nitrososphaera evergladensis]AIF83255.1 ParB-like partition protein [Candidatus Nitrososphaera evergladensis SR1]